MNAGIVKRYQKYIPLPTDAKVISLGEGATPLIPLKRISDHIGAGLHLYAKVEGMNPTGSFKDRGMTVAVSHAMSEGATAIVCASTGNTSASAAAYAAQAGLRCFVLIPAGKISLGKLVQANVHGAVVVQIRGNFDEGLDLVRELPKRLPVNIVNSINPWRIHGQKTAAFEIVDELEDPPDYHCMPVGNAGNITAYWRGYNEYVSDDTAKPTMVGYQSAGAAPLVHGKVVAEPDTIATAIRIGNPASWDGAVTAVKESNGWLAACDDSEILAAQRMLASMEGLFCEPASAISLAGVIRDAKAGRFRHGATLACVLTGAGLKDIDTALSHSREPITVDADIDAVTDLMAKSDNETAA